VPSNLSVEGVKYQLSGVIVHAGRSSNAGHYYTIARSGSKWLLCNDSSVSELSSSSLSGTSSSSFDITSYINRSIGGKFATDTPYMLSYEKIEDQATNDPQI